MGFSIFENTYDVYCKGEMNLHTLYQVVTLQKLLSDCATTTWKCMDLWPYQVKYYRTTGIKHIKEKQLPAIIPFALTQPEDRKAIVKQSGLFCTDLDYSDNKKLFDEQGITAIKKLIAAIWPSAALVFISPSGRGLKVLHLIEPFGEGADDHYLVSRRVFEQYQRSYSKIGLTIDSKCVDWNRLCYLSYDREAYYNISAVPDVIAVSIPVIIPPPVIMGSENGYQLSCERRDKDQICPRCGGGPHRDKSFTYYEDQNGARLDGCGVCSRSKCSANIKPWENYPNVKWRYLGKVRTSF